MGRIGERTFEIIIPKGVKRKIIKLPEEYRNPLGEIFRTLRENPIPTSK